MQVIDVSDVATDCAHPRLLNKLKLSGSPTSGHDALGELPVLGSASVPANVLGHEGGWAPDGKTYYATGAAGSSLTAIDVSDPSRPRIVYVGLHGPAVNHSPSVSDDGNRLYLATAFPAGFLVLDVSDIQQRAPIPLVRQISAVKWNIGGNSQGSPTHTPAITRRTRGGQDCCACPSQNTKFPDAQNAWPARRSSQTLVSLLGACTRVYLVADPDVFRLCAAALLLPLGAWLSFTHPRRATRGRHLRTRSVTALAVVAGFVGGVYGIGGGSLLGPVLVGAGLSIAAVVPATLLCTFATSIVGCLARGIGGLIGAALQPRLPERLLRRLLGALAIALAGTYTVQALS